jgi:MFS family permease
MGISTVYMRLTSRCATSMIGAPAMTEITLQLRNHGGKLQGNGYAQGYGWFNVAYSIGTLSGPLIAAWIVEKWEWTGLCFAMGTLAGITIVPVLLFTGGKVDEKEAEIE